MKRIIYGIATLSLIGWLGWYAGLGCGLGNAQDIQTVRQPANPIGRTRWEYKSTQSWVPSMQDLNILGAKGWELAAVVTTKDHQPYYIFKRPKQGL